jgi:hypothetical protein
LPEGRFPIGETHQLHPFAPGQCELHVPAFRSPAQSNLHLAMRLSEVYFDKEWLVMGHPLVNKQKAIENGDLVRGFTHSKWWIFPVRFL